MQLSTICEIDCFINSNFLKTAECKVDWQLHCHFHNCPMISLTGDYKFRLINKHEKFDNKNNVVWQIHLHSRLQQLRKLKHWILYVNTNFNLGKSEKWMKTWKLIAEKLMWFEIQRQADSNKNINEFLQFFDLNRHLEWDSVSISDMFSHLPSYSN